jgi:hypothetical protein
VKWRFSALAGGVEGSKFCLFLVILPAKCVFSVSPRFHYRRLAFCFLPVAAIFPLPPVILIELVSFVSQRMPVDNGGKHVKNEDIIGFCRYKNIALFL